MKRRTCSSDFQTVSKRGDFAEITGYLCSQWSESLDSVRMNTPEPPPKENNHPPVWDLVLADIKERDQVGTSKYGIRLQPFNGRDVLKDAYQEALDLVVYLRQAIYERDEGWKKIRNDFKLENTEEPTI